MSPPEPAGGTHETARRRLDFVESTIETVDEHVDDQADSRALVRALGVLEQIAVDLSEHEASSESERE